MIRDSFLLIGVIWAQNARLSGSREKSENRSEGNKLQIPHSTLKLLSKHSE